MLDEPIKEMLDNVMSGLTVKVLERFYDGDESKISVIDYLGVKPAPIPSLPGAHVLQTGNEVKLTLPASLSAAEHWLCNGLVGVCCTRHTLYEHL
jgi:fatty acid synthase subunit alpha, fungi type